MSSGAFEAAPPLGGKRHYTALSISPKGGWVVAASTKNMVDLWSLPERNDDGTMRPGEGPFRAFRAGTSKKSMTDVAYSPDGRKIAGACGDCGLHLWEMPRSPGGRQNEPIGEQKVHFGHLFPANAIAWSRDGKQIVSMGADRRLVVFDAKTGKHDTLEGPRHTFNTVAMHPIERHVAAGSDDDLIWIWDMATAVPRQLVAYPVHAGRWKRFINRVVSLAWSPDGRMLAASCSRDPAVHLFRYPDLKKMLEFKPLGEPVSALSFGKDPKRLAVGGSQGSLVMVDLGNRKNIAASRLGGRVTGLAWHERWLVAASGEKQLHPFHVQG